MFGITLTHTRAHDFKIGARTVRVSISLNNGGSGCYGPNATLFFKGPNNSVSGYGQTRQPINFTLPHLPWYRAYKLRRFGALKVYSLISRAYRKAL